MVRFKSPHLIRRRHVALGTSLVLATHALAVETPTDATAQELDPMLVTETASRVTENVADVPQDVVIVDQESIERRQTTTPIEMLREQPGIWAVNVASQGSPIVRGQIGNRVVYLWDGVRINNGALFGGPNGFFNGFPVGAVDHMEVVLGSGSVQYGSDAIGGVVNVFSKSAPFTDMPTVGGSVYGRYGSNNDENTETFDFHASNSKVAFAGGITRQEVGDYHASGFDPVSPSGYDAIGGYANLAWRPVDNQVLKLSWVYNERTDVESYVQSKLNPNGVPRIFGPLERRGIAKLDYTLTELGMCSDEFRVYGYYNYYDGIRDRRVEGATSFDSTRREQDQDVWGLGIQNAKSWGNVRLIAGVDYRNEALSSSQKLTSSDLATAAFTRSVPAGNTPDGTYDVFDTFTTVTWKATPDWLFSAGLRFESTHLDSKPTASDVIPNAGYTEDDLDLEKRWNSVTWNVGSTYDLTDEWRLAANVGTGFRAPTYSDVLSAGTPIYSSLTASVPSPDVDPERSITVDFGPRYQSDCVSAKLTGYYTDLSNVVGSDISGTVVIPGQGTFDASRNKNIGSGYVTGVEAAAAWRFADGWSLFGNSTFTHGEDTTADDPYRFIPPLNGVLGVRYTSQDGKWWVELVEVMAGRLTRHSLRDEQDSGFSKDPGLGSPNTTTNPPLRSDYDIPGFAVTNLRAGMKVWEHDTSALDLTLDLNNLLDTSYREAYAQQQPEAPGFGVVMGARLTF